MEAAKKEVGKPFSEEEKLAELLKEQVSLNLALEFEQEEKPVATSYSGSIYRKLSKLAPGLFDGTYFYLKFKKDHFDDLVMEKMGEKEYRIAHYYVQNGDLMRDPQITFRVKEDQREVCILSYAQDNLGIYQETTDRSEEEIEELLAFFDQWLVNIRNQGFVLHEARGERTEYQKEREKREEEQER